MHVDLRPIGFNLPAKDLHEQYDLVQADIARAGSHQQDQQRLLTETQNRLTQVESALREAQGTLGELRNELAAIEKSVPGLVLKHTAAGLKALQKDGAK